MVEGRWQITEDEQTLPQQPFILIKGVFLEGLYLEDIPLYLETDMANNTQRCTINNVVWTTGEDQLLTDKTDIPMTDREER